MKKYCGMFATLCVSIFVKADDLKIPSVFSDHMVLQRDAMVNIWGRGKPGAQVEIEFVNQKVFAEVLRDGNWAVTLDPLEVSEEGRDFSIKSGEEKIILKDVLVGDVWFCSGQSNMEWTLGKSRDGDIEICGSHNPMIRLFQVDRSIVQESRFSALSEWLVCSPNSVIDFSAVAYYFGKDLQKVLNIPIGIIDCSWGGTPIVAWIPEEQLLTCEHTATSVRKWNNWIESYEEYHAEWEKRVEEYCNMHDVTVIHSDSGISDEARQYVNEHYDDTGWDVVLLPDTFEHHIGDIDGAIWYRKKVDLSVQFKGVPLVLHLGAIDDMDVAFVNGVEVGSHANPKENSFALHRKYMIPEAMTATGSLVVAVRVFDKVGAGGFMSDPRAMFLENGNGESIQLAGQWRYRVELALPSAIGPWNIPGLDEPEGSFSPNRPGILARSMLDPVSPFALKGTIWYQGESDADWLPDRYDERLALMLRDWRSRWQQPELPLGIVQLANYRNPSDRPTDTSWSHLRDSQLRFSRKDPKVGLAVTIDIGEADEIHPRNKFDVGRRLSRWALADIYGVIDLSSGPIFESSLIDEATMEISFENVGSGLKTMNGGILSGFTIAGIDRRFYPATAVIVGRDKIAVHSEDVPFPTAVRYAWGENPKDANLINNERLPASPFRTDDWEYLE